MKSWWKSTPDEGILRFDSGRRGPVFGLALLALAAYVLSGSLMEIIQCPYHSCTRQEMVVWNIAPLLGSSILCRSTFPAGLAKSSIPPLTGLMLGLIPCTKQIIDKSKTSSENDGESWNMCTLWGEIRKNAEG
jgi:hypothetical protein